MLLLVNEIIFIYLRLRFSLKNSHFDEIKEFFLK